MKVIIFLSILFCTGCQTLPQLYQAAEDIADDTAINVKISREAIQKETNVGVTVDVKNSQDEIK